MTNPNHELATLDGPLFKKKGQVIKEQIPPQGIIVEPTDEEMETFLEPTKYYDPSLAEAYNRMKERFLVQNFYRLNRVRPFKGKFGFYALYLNVHLKRHGRFDPGMKEPIYVGSSVTNLYKRVIKHLSSVDRSIIDPKDVLVRYLVLDDDEHKWDVLAFEKKMEDEYFVFWNKCVRGFGVVNVHDNQRLPSWDYLYVDGENGRFDKSLKPIDKTKEVVMAKALRDKDLNSPYRQSWRNDWW